MNIKSIVAQNASGRNDLCAIMLDLLPINMRLILDDRKKVCSLNHHKAPFWVWEIGMGSMHGSARVIEKS